MILRYNYFTEEPLAIPKLYSIGYAYDERVTRFGPARRDQYLIHYVISGKGYFNGTKVAAGEGFITTPEMREHYYPDMDDPWRYVWIISYDPEIEDIIKMHAADKSTGVFKFHNINVVESVADRLMSMQCAIELSSTEMTEMYLRIFNSCVQAKPKVNTPNSKMYFDYTVKYISLNLHISISVGDICKKLGVSQPYLYKVFKNEIGISPKAYITECRINEAKRQLLNTKFTVSEIAALLGFADVLSFSKFFSGKTKLSPTEYRKRAGINIG